MTLIQKTIEASSSQIVFCGVVNKVTYFITSEYLIATVCYITWY